MRQELEESLPKKKMRFIHKARAEAEELSSRLKMLKEGIRRDIEKNMEIKIIDYSIRVVNDVLAPLSKMLSIVNFS